MTNNSMLSRRGFLTRTAAGSVGIATRGANTPFAAKANSDKAPGVSQQIKDPEVRAGVVAAIHKNILPAAVETAYPGHFQITADGSSYGGDATWPGLDSWQMAGAYLLLGRSPLAMDYFDFVRASQRKDGNIPFAVFLEMKANNTCLRGLKWPDDVFSYTPPKRDGLPASSQKTRKWIGLFDHWQNIGEPLTNLGPVCYILTAAEIFSSLWPKDWRRAVKWVRERIDSLDAAGKFLWSRQTENGLIGGSGFYSEQPPREQWDGVTQCYAIHAFQKLENLHTQTDPKPGEGVNSVRRRALTKKFSELFWRDDHFAEYIHPQHGLVDSHGLSDVNWAAVAFGVATDEQVKKLWPRLMDEKGFWFGDMPTLTVTKPFAYEGWEQNFGPPCPVPPLNDVAAMGRAWYLEAMACKRMKAHDRLIESVRKVCNAGKADGYWRERYHPQKDGTVKAEGAAKYCEYPAVLTRVVLGTPEVFCA
jgi:hypothetical protein